GWLPGSHSSPPQTLAEMTLPRAERERLIFVASRSRSPVALSFPARRWSWPAASEKVLQISRWMVKMEWEREESLFISRSRTYTPRSGCSFS
uniref:Uncharacterized protein n=1 Tax=Stegastes partitus TaxID=144197 RepID=A0A3B4YU72_9TELE